jgi:hypothetical protein
LTSQAADVSFVPIMNEGMESTARSASFDTLRLSGAAMVFGHASVIAGGHEIAATVA